MLPLILLAASGLVAALPSNNAQEPGKVRPTLSLGNITKGFMNSDMKGRSLSGPQLGVDFPDPSLIYGDGS